MKTVCTDVFKFDELSDEAKEKARDWYRNGTDDDSSWPEFVLEDAERLLAFTGWDVSKVYFTGFWSQGDGACFEGTWAARDVNVDKLKEEAPNETELHRIAEGLAAIAAQFPDGSISVRRLGHYTHQYCASFADFEPGAAWDDAHENTIYKSPEYKAECAVISATDESIKDLSRDAMRWVYRKLEAEYEYQNADAQVDDNIRANEYTFTESGRRFG